MRPSATTSAGLPVATLVVVAVVASATTLLGVMLIGGGEDPANAASSDPGASLELHEGFADLRDRVDQIAERQRRLEISLLRTTHVDEPEAAEPLVAQGSFTSGIQAPRTAITSPAARPEVRVPGVRVPGELPPPGERPPTPLEGTARLDVDLALAAQQIGFDDVQRSELRAIVVAAMLERDELAAAARSSMDLDTLRTGLADIAARTEAQYATVLTPVQLETLKSRPAFELLRPPPILRVLKARERARK